MDDFEDTLVYSMFLLLSMFISIYGVFFSLISVFRLSGDWLFGDVLGHDWNPTLKNTWVLIFLLLFCILGIFFLFYFQYNLRKFNPDSKSYLKRLFKDSFIFLILIVSLKLIVQYLIDININIDTFLNLICLSFYLLFIIGFSINFVPFLFILGESVVNIYSGNFANSQQKYDNPIKIKFREAQYELEKIIEKLYKNKNGEYEDIVVQKKLLDFYSVSDYYNGGINELKKSFGNAVNFDKINYLNLNNKENINEIFHQLSLSIPFYIFYGRLEQMKELDMHIKNIVNFLDKEYSIAGYQFINEIIEMNNKIKKYLEDNSFELQPIDEIHSTKKYKKILFILLPLLISIIKVWYFA